MRDNSITHMGIIVITMALWQQASSEAGYPGTLKKEGMRSDLSSSLPYSFTILRTRRKLSCRFENQGLTVTQFRTLI
jgi:hypothetical protein